MNEIAIFGGTFDPPTKAHEAIIAACIQHPTIDEVWVMPSGMRHDKPTMTSNLGRLAMLKLVKQDVFADSAQLQVTDFEQNLPQPTETHRTANALQQSYPGNRFWFVFGADSYHNMPTWHSGADLQKQLNMLLLEREGYGLPPESERLKHLHIPPSFKAVSSTAIRATCNQDLSELITPSVADFITINNLYGRHTLNNRMMA